MCEDCFNGCSPEATLDKCVKYSGPDNATLGICQGDPLSVVEKKLIDNVVLLLTGTNSTAYTFADNCNFFKAQIGSSAYTLPNVLNALVKGECSLKASIDAINLILNAPLTINANCLTLPTNPTKNDILAAVANKLCSVSASVNTILADYVKASELDAAIAAYIDSTSPTSPSGVTQQYTKMVPYVAYEYYGPLSNFDATGKGLSANSFELVYLCNGLNGTPDKRGRVAVGAIANVPGATLDSAVDPALPANAGKNWVLNQKFGSSSEVLDLTQMPAHTHTVIDGGHTHDIPGANANWNSGSPDGKLVNPSGPSGFGATKLAKTNITLDNSGASQAHNNMQPSIAAYFIMYIPR